MNESTTVLSERLRQVRPDRRLSSVPTLDQLSGVWVGWSIQDGLRIHERMTLRLGGGTLSGSGEDKDGDFQLDGNYEMDGEVAIVRQYTYCTSGPEGIGIPYIYRGRWDGAFIAGDWRPVFGSMDGGPFEMWPEQAAEETSAAENEQETVLTAP